MKKILKAIALFAGVVLILSACDEYNELTSPTINFGTANFSRFVSIGNSLTMAEQSGSVFESGQMYSFGNLIANIVGTTYEQAIFSEPGTPGRLEIGSLDLANGTVEIVVNPNGGVPTNLTYPAPYNNLGVKGAFLPDVLNARDASTSYTAQFGSPNPLFDAVLRGFGTQLELAMVQQPTFVTLWIGENDILAFATRGGLFPITPVAQFATAYNTILDNLQTTGAGVIIGNIPDVKNIPYFKTVGPGIGLALQDLMLINPAVQGLVYQTGTGGIGLATPADLLPDATFVLKVLVTLTASTAATLIGDDTGAYYAMYGIPVPANVNTAFPFGLAPENPWPNNLILDPGEIGIVDQIVAAYNGIIVAAANDKGYAVADIHTVLNDIGKPGGIVENGLRFTSDFLLGNTYSLDGVHPTSQGYGLIANEFIKAINQKYGASIPPVDISTIPGSLVLSKGVSLGKYGIPVIPEGALDHILF
jgi:lysophospholipase L1-like esterase